MFSAISIAKADAGYQATLRELDDSELPDGDVTVRVSYSGLNYKDALAITGKAPVVRRFPMVPGIDLAGVVEHSDSPSYAPGDRVLVNGWGIGETHWGGLAQRARVSADWLVPVPDAISERQAMSIGTASTASSSSSATRRAGTASRETCLRPALRRDFMTVCDLPRPPVPVTTPVVTAAPTMPPMSACVVETGQPIRVASSSQMAAPASAAIMM